MELHFLSKKLQRSDLYRLKISMLITITGMNGSGKSTAAQIIAKTLGYEYISIGNMKRALAAEM